MDELVDFDIVLRALGSDSWTLLAGALLMCSIFIFRKAFIHLVPKRELGLVAAGVAVLGEIGVALLRGESLMKALLSGLLVGTVAVGFWEVLGKRIKAWTGNADPSEGSHDASE